MRIQIDVALHYRFDVANTVFLALEAAQTEGQVVERAGIELGNATVSRIGGDAGVGERIWARVPGPDFVVTYQSVCDITRDDAPLDRLSAAPLHDIPTEAAPYLRPSRYCQSDKFGALVKKRFGHVSGGAKVAAIRDWIEDNLSFVPGSSDADTNVLETFAGREGVCRDYAHLMCSMVRAAEIPARMVAVYGPGVTPQDFHAVTQVWLDDAWHLVDATGMCSPDSMAIVAVGRDAYDIAFMGSQENATMLYQSVEVKPV